MCSLPREIHLPTAHCFAFLSAVASNEYGFAPPLSGRQVVSAVEVDRVDGFQRHELRDVDGVRWWCPRAP